MINETKDEIILETPHQILERKHYVGINTTKFEDLQGMKSTNQTRCFPITYKQAVYHNNNGYVWLLLKHNQWNCNQIQ